MEGVGSYKIDGILHRDVSDDRPIQPAFMMSFSADVEATKKFGKYYCVLQDPGEFEKRLRNALPPGITSVEWGEVEYTKTMELDSLPSPSDDLRRKYFCKPERFSDEKEWRILISFLHTFRPLNKTMKIAASGLNDLFSVPRKHRKRN